MRMTTEPSMRRRLSQPALRTTLLLTLALAAPLMLPAEGRAQNNLSSGLVSHWRLDEPPGSREDFAGDNNLVDVGGVGQAADGKLGKAAVFTMAGAKHLAKENNADLSIQPGESFTCAGWFYLSSKSAYMGLFGKDDTAGAREYMLYYDQGMDRLVWMVFNTSDLADPVIASTFGSPQERQWHFVVVWYDAAAGTIGIQVNNQTANTKAHSGGIKDSFSAFKLGMGLAGGAGFDGRIDSFSFWRRALTGEERAELWNGGDGKDPTAGATTTPSGPGWAAGPNGSILYTAGNVGVGPGMTNPLKALEVNGSLHVTGTITGGVIEAKFQDVAEWVPSAQKLAAATVVILDPDRNNQVMASTRPYDTRVAGVVSPRPGLALGEGGEGKVLVATTGRVKVRVDATRGSIRVGDLLVTSGVEGVAMKSVPVRVGGVRMHRPGTIVGKALEPLAGGVGEILVLLSLQ